MAASDPRIFLTTTEATDLLGTLDALEQHVPSELVTLALEVAEMKALLIDRLFPELPPGP